MCRVGGFHTFAMFVLSLCVCEANRLGTLRYNDATETRTSVKSEFAFFQCLSQLFQPTYFVKCRQTLLKLNSKRPYLSSEGEIKFRPCIFMFSINHDIRHFPIIIVQKRQI